MNRVNSMVKWGTGYENILYLRRPAYEVLTDHKSREGSEMLKLPSGGRSSYIVGRDYTIEMAWRWLPYDSSDTSTPTPWSGPTGVQSFLDWMRDGNACRFVPDETYVNAYVDACYLDDPFDGGGQLDDLIRRTQRLTLVNASADFGLAMRGMFLQYEPQGDYTRLLPLPTFSRGSVANYKASDLTPTQAASGALRDRHYFSSGLRCTLLEGAGTNLCLQSSNFGTTWATVGTPTRSAAAITFGIVVLDLIGDDAAGTLEGYSQTITFTGDAVKAVSIYLYPGTSTSNVIRLRDTTAGADRLLAAVTWSGATPSVAMTTGTFLGYETTIAGLVRLLFRTTSVTAANTNSLQVYPATNAALTVASTGDVNAGGVQAENAAVPSSYNPTTTGTATRATDAFTYALPTALAIPQAAWFYIKFVEQGTALTTAETGLFSIGRSTAQAAYVYNSLGTGHYSFAHDTSSASVTSTLSTGPVYGDTVELLCLLYSDGSVQILQSLNGAASTSASRSAANSLTPTWSTSELRLNDRTSGSNTGQIGVIDFRCGPGTAVNTLALARAA